MTIANLHIWHFLHSNFDIVTEVTCKNSGWIFLLYWQFRRKGVPPKKKKRAQNIKCKCVKVHRFISWCCIQVTLSREAGFFCQKRNFWIKPNAFEAIKKNVFNHELGKLPLSYFTPTRSLEGGSHGVTASSYYGCLRSKSSKEKSRQTRKQTHLNWRQVNNLRCLFSQKRRISIDHENSGRAEQNTERTRDWSLSNKANVPAPKEKKKRAFARLMRFEPSHTFPWSHRRQNHSHLCAHTDSATFPRSSANKAESPPGPPPPWPLPSRHAALKRLCVSERLSVLGFQSILFPKTRPGSGGKWVSDRAVPHLLERGHYGRSAETRRET